MKRLKKFVTGVAPSVVVLYCTLVLSGEPVQSQDLTVLGTLSVRDNSVVGGNLGVAGSAGVGGNLAVIGNTGMTGSLGVTGPSTLSNTTVIGTLGVSQNSVVGGDLGVAGNAGVGGNLAVIGSAGVSGNFGVTGTTNLGNVNMAGDAGVGRNLAVIGDAGVSGNFGVTGTTNLTNTNVIGDSVFSGDVDITGEVIVRRNDTVLDVNGNGLNLRVGTNTGVLNVTTSSVTLKTDGSGFEAFNGDTVTESSAVISGGTNKITVSNSGVAFSGTDDAPVVLSGVADPIAETDAVNLRTLRNTDSANLSNLRGEMSEVEGKLSGGIAQAMAMTQLPTPDFGKSSSIGIALGKFNAETALAFGASVRLENGAMLRGAASQSNAGQTGFAIGAGWSW